MVAMLLAEVLSLVRREELTDLRLLECEGYPQSLSILCVSHSKEQDVLCPYNKERRKTARIRAVLAGIYSKLP